MINLYDRGKEDQEISTRRTPLNALFKVFVSQYQNFLFLLDPTTGIFVYNSLGKQIRKIPSAGLGHFNFLGEELYYKEEGKLKFLDLFTAETREMNLPTPTDFVLLTDERMIVATKDQVVIFEFTP